mmetsp:Transcript_83114/g.173990  ORF Transcript_83114/g.173990 Transcript_83114/m.173990 type:complete len:208 (-) Transcript_83114:233-856(-)
MANPCCFCRRKGPPDQLGTQGLFDLEQDLELPSTIPTSEEEWRHAPNTDYEQVGSMPSVPSKREGRRKGTDHEGVSPGRCGRPRRAAGEPVPSSNMPRWKSCLLFVAVAGISCSVLPAATWLGSVCSGHFAPGASAGSRAEDRSLVLGPPSGVGSSNPAINLKPTVVNCNEGLTNWKRGWSVEKKDWCCLHERKGCPDQESWALHEA